jgi:hypothetical protein
VWADSTDCMINYVQNYYPNGCSYIINWEDNHIDKCWLENEIMTLDSTVKWCNVKQAWLINVPYCYYTLAFETILWNTK